MRWLQITVPFTDDDKEMLFIELLDLGIQGLQEDEFSYTFYLPDTLDPKETFLDKEILAKKEFTSQIVEDEDWAETWKQYWHANKISRFVIVPSWESYEKATDEIVINLDPGMAFGTGAHETTSLVLELLDQLETVPNTAFDIGSGTGILAIATAKLGADVYAFDIDPLAVDATLENAEKNQVSNKVIVKGGNLLEDESLYPKAIKPDLVLTNIIAEVIVEFVPILKEKYQHFTWLLSGIIEERLPMVLDSLEEHGFTVTKKLQRGEWVALEAKAYATVLR